MLAVLMSVLVGLGAKDASRFEFRQTHMGSEFKIVLYTTDEAVARRASDAGFARIAALDKALSDYDPESELSRLGDVSGGPAVPVSDDLLQCLVKAKEMAQLSDGAFDPTIAPVGRLWRRTRRNFILPKKDELDRTRALVGFRPLEIDAVAKTVRLAKKGMKLDVGGIAKGFACDEALAAISRFGITSALVAGAGDIVASGPPPGERGWTVGVADPAGDPLQAARRVLVHHAAVSTSGDAERFVEIEGRRYSHIVDPRTGYGVERRASVTIIARDGATADSLATAAFVLGPGPGRKLVESLGAAGLFVVAGEEPGTFASARWAEAPRVEAFTSGEPTGVVPDRLSGR